MLGHPRPADGWPPHATKSSSSARPVPATSMTSASCRPTQTLTRAAALSELAVVSQHDWWQTATPDDVQHAWETAQRWREHEPAANRAAVTLRAEHLRRTDIDLAHGAGTNASDREQVREIGKARFPQPAAAAANRSPRHQPHGRPVGFTPRPSSPSVSGERRTGAGEFPGQRELGAGATGGADADTEDRLRSLQLATRVRARRGELRRSIGSLPPPAGRRELAASSPSCSRRCSSSVALSWASSFSNCRPMRAACWSAAPWRLAASVASIDATLKARFCSAKASG